MVDFSSDESSEELWVELNGATTRWLLGWNPHTSFGRIGASDPSTGRSTRFSLDEVTGASDSARAWIAGFLAGNEPEPEDMFGPAVLDAELGDERLGRWRSALAEFRRTGHWPHGKWELLIPFPAAAVLRTVAWVLRGDEVWEWTGDSWRRVNPPPVVRIGTLLVGTLCSERGHHAMESVTDVHLVCIDCGMTTFCLPEGVGAEEFERLQHDWKATPVGETSE